LTVKDVISLYRRHAAAEGVHSSSAKSECDLTLGLFIAAHGNFAVDECKPFLLTDFIADHPEWKSTATRRKKAAVVRAAFQWAWREERISRNPFRNVTYAEAERRPEMPDQSLGMILDIANKHAERVLRFIRLTACRVTEACRAEWPHVDLGRGTWLIPQHKTRKRTGREKMVALVPEAVELLRGMAGAPAGALPALDVTVVAAGPAKPIFLNSRGEPWNANAIWRVVDRAKTRLGLATEASTHGLRHRAATAMIVAGAAPALVAAQLGHATTATVERHYLHLENQMDAIRAAVSLGVPKTSQ
jgi:integrase